MNLSEYKNEILEKYQAYHPIVHSLEKGYYLIDISNKNQNHLFIHLEDEVTLSFGEWHCHYLCEDREDFLDILEVIDGFLLNEECYISIYSNQEFFGSGSILHKTNYQENDLLAFLKSFLGKRVETIDSFRTYGVHFKCHFWDSSKDYEVYIKPEKFKKGND